MIRAHQSRYCAPENDKGGGGAEDRGDDFASTEEEDDAGTGTDTLKGGAGDDTTKGGAGDDTTKGDAGDDTVDAGDDTAAAEEKKDDDKKAEEKKAKDTRIPLARHKALLEKERDARAAVERELAQYQKGRVVADVNKDINDAETKILALDTEYAQLITDGKHVEAAAKMKEIRTLERQVGDKKVELRTAAATAQAVEKMRYDIVVDRLEEAYPVLNPQSEEHDEEKAQDVLDLASTYRNVHRMTPGDALQKAAKKLLGVEGKKQTDAVEVTPRVDADEAKKKAAEEERKKAAVKKNLDAEKKQPADTSKLGADSDKNGGSISAKDVMKMSQDDFAKLDEETLARMRGDVIA